MGIPVTWTPTSNSLQQIYSDLTARSDRWPAMNFREHRSTEEMM